MLRMKEKERNNADLHHERQKNTHASKCEETAPTPVNNVSKNDLLHKALTWRISQVSVAEDFTLCGTG